MAKLIAGESIASTAGDTPPNGSNLPTDPMNKVQGIPSGIRNMPESGSRSAPSHPQVPTASRKSASAYAAAKLHLIALHISDYNPATRDEVSGVQARRLLGVKADVMCVVRGVRFVP